jgi:hypothetical protein
MRVWGHITEGVVGSAGREFSSPDGDIKVTFQPGAVTEPVTVTFSVVYSPSAPPPASYAFAGKALALEAVYVSDGQPLITFDEPVTITISYAADGLHGQDENTLELRHWNGSAWSDEGVTIEVRDQVNDRLAATITHLTEFSLFGKYRLYLPAVWKAHDAASRRGQTSKE